MITQAIVDPFLFGALTVMCVTRMRWDQPAILNIGYGAIALTTIVRILTQLKQLS